MVNAKTIALIKEFEGCKLEPYQDQGGVWTVGYGHTQDVDADTPRITQEEAELFLEEDLDEVETSVRRLLCVPVTDNQCGALVCFGYNVGIGNLSSSTLWKQLNAGNYEAAAEQFQRWNKIKIHGEYVESSGLSRRRDAEKALFMSEE